MATIGYILSHEQFTVPDLLKHAVLAQEAGSEAVSGSDYLIHSRVGRDRLYDWSRYTLRRMCEYILVSRIWLASSNSSTT